MNKQKIVIEIKDLRKSYGNNHVLNGFNMRLVEGENLVIMGKSGSGKSVMIKCLIYKISPLKNLKAVLQAQHQAGFASGFACGGVIKSFACVGANQGC